MSFSCGFDWHGATAEFLVEQGKESKIVQREANGEDNGNARRAKEKIRKVKVGRYR